ncbi:hypothetical protein KUH32_08360 [Thalassococcus sp. CAU 1522]|uniref:Uncharacterized protein n=1 Tax=Thalassococcus arenae TaxID=2851652 RepID=A0ABS6N869_9RHOB|nr:hypothetical protein [Thalassococcus arenae]MBV2359784.1 hypothetical protein [Thalassococcus arenae]
MTDDPFLDLPADAPDPDGILARNPEDIRDLAAIHGLDFLHSVRSVWFQSGPPVEQAIEHRILSDRTDETVDAMEHATAFLRDLPHALRYDLSEPGRATPTAKARAFALAAQPAAQQVLTLWERLSGLYSVLPPHPADVTVYLPFFDYQVAPSVEKALTVAVKAGRTDSQTVKLSATIKKIGLIGTGSRSKTCTFDGQPRDHAYQVVLPARLRLRRYQGPMQADIRYSVRLVDIDTATLFPAGDPDYVALNPGMPVRSDSRFLNADAIGDTVIETLQKSEGIEATLSHSPQTGVTLGLEYKTETRSDVTVTYRKARDDRLMRRQFYQLEGHVEIYPAA